MTTKQNVASVAVFACVLLTATAQTPGRVTLVRADGQLTLSWDSVVGRRYRLFSTTTLGLSWQEVDTQPKPLVATSARLSYAVSLAPESRYYCVAEEDRFVWIPPGTFTMGSPDTEQDRKADEGPQTVVTLTHGFWMSRHEVTQREFLTVLGTNPSQFTGDLERPVEKVSWDEATNYCGQLTRSEAAAGRLPAAWAYRLPTEAEWEYACRAGTTTRFSYGDDPAYAELGNYAWYSMNSYRLTPPPGGFVELNGKYFTTHPVGTKLPNPWDLHDLYGNVYEWCSDWYAMNYPGGSVTDPQGPGSGSNRVLRGGSWYYDEYPRSAFRNFGPPGNRFNNGGFRTVLAPGW